MNNRKLLTLTLTATIMAVFVFLSTNPTREVKAIPQTYDWHALYGNLYTSQSLLYLFDNLDASTQYTMHVQELDVNGNLLRTLKTFQLPTATTTSFLMLYWEWPSGFGPAQNENVGAIRVMDQFGQVLGFHWVSLPCDSAWTANNVVAIGDVCRNTPTAGFFHDSSDVAASSYDSYYNEATFIHYRVASTSTTDRVHIYNNDTGVIEQDFDLSAFVLYNESVWSCNVASCSANALGVDGTKQFVALGINGDESIQGGNEPIIDSGAEFRAYTSPGTDNPNHFDLAGVFGAYDYHIRDSTDVTTVNNGESIFLYSSVNPTNEWTIAIGLANVTISEDQTVTLTNTTENIGSAYTNHVLTDSVIGTIDSGTYTYNKTRTIIYTVDSVVSNNNNVTWTIAPNSLSVSGFSPDDYEFEITSSNYNITAAGVTAPFKERQRSLKTALGLDTIFGSTVLLTFFWFLGLKGANTIDRGNHILQFAMFALIGVGYWLIFDMPLLIKILFAISVIFLGIMAISNPRKASV